MPLGCLAASLRLHVASLAVLFHHGCACLSVSQSSGSGRKLYQPSFFFFSFFLFSRCDFLLPQGRLVIRLRAPPTWRLPTPSILSSQITPATASEKSSYLEAANAIHPEQPDRTSHYVCSLCPSQSLNPKDVLNLCPSQSLNPPAVTVSGTSKSRYRPYRSPPTSTLHSYYCSS